MGICQKWIANNEDAIGTISSTFEGMRRFVTD
jgi:hypothetical protein